MTIASMRPGHAFFGSFDPITNGHLDVWRRACEQLGEPVNIVIVRSTFKTPTFELHERLRIIRNIVPEDEAKIFLGTSVEAVRYLKQEATTIIKGRRDADDERHTFDILDRLYGVGRKKLLQIDADPDLAGVSSSELKKLVLSGDLKAARQYAQDPAVDALVKKLLPERAAELVGASFSSESRGSRQTEQVLGLGLDPGPNVTTRGLL